MDQTQDERSQRQEGIAFGQYLAVRMILFAVIATVTLGLTGFLVGFVYGLGETTNLISDAEGLMGAIWIVGGLVAVTFLVRSFTAYSDHGSAHRKLLALRPYTSWTNQLAKTVRRIADDG